MTYYLKRGDTYQVTSKTALDLHERLPGGNFILRPDAQGHIFLAKVDDFEINHKLYGDVAKNTHRILNTFDKRPGNTGILLNGEKGSGKTLLAKNICAKAAAAGIPTIIINAAWHGDAFNALIQSIEQPAILLFDEFEKVYDKDKQEAILTLLDGVFPTKKMFILTCNDKWRIDAHMRNRPGRIFYMMDFDGLGTDFIRDYCVDNLVNQDYVDKVVQIAGTFSKFNFDMLKALLEEMNRYGETPSDALKMLNVKAEFCERQIFTYTLHVNGKQLPKEDIGDHDEISKNPLLEATSIEYTLHEKDKDQDDVYQSALFYVNDLKKIDNAGKRYTFTNSQGHTLVLTKKECVPQKYNYDSVD